VTAAFSRRDFVFIILAGIFVTNAIIGELIGGKLISLGPYNLFNSLEFGPFSMSIGVIPWPVVFLTTDLINEFFGRQGVKRLSFITAGLIIYTFIILIVAMEVPTASFSPVTDEQFRAVFGQSMWIIVGSLVAFLLSQLIDVSIFWAVRDRTGHGMLWLRSTGSTVISQLIDTFVVIGIAFWLPGKLSTSEYFNLSSTNYCYKLALAIALTPIIYGAHSLIHLFLGHSATEKAIEEAVLKSNLK